MNAQFILKKMIRNSKGYLILMAFVISLLYMCKSTHSIGKQDTALWYDKLPPCPCESPDKDSTKLNDGWAKDKGNIAKYHKGAAESYRSYPAVSTSEGQSGQQCCYDSLGNLITGGSGAGTPDKESTCDGEDSKGVMTMRWSGVISHYNKDVRPWENYGGADSGWVKYNQLWKPDNRNKCSENIVIR